MTKTPATLLQRLQTANDAEAWGRFVELYTPLLLSWANRLGLRHQEAADLVQDVFTLLVQKLPGFSYDHSRSFRGWLRTVAHNLWRNSIARRRPGAVAELDDIVAPQEEAFWEAEYRRHLVDRALEVMRGEFQSTTWQACWESVVSGRSAEDVGRQFGLSAEAVRAAKYRVLSRLRRELEGLLD